MTFRTDLSRLDWAYRARRSGQSPVEYASSVQRFAKPRRQWGSWLATLAILLAAFVVARA